MVGLDKEYLATIRLGLATTTDDAEGEAIGAVADASGVTDEAIAAAIVPLTGEISQRPSTVSAIKVDGKRAYALAREGVEVELKERAVTVSAFEVLDRRDRRDGSPSMDVDVRVECSSGTYIRALARDLGAALGVGGHLTALRRTRDRAVRDRATRARSTTSPPSSHRRMPRPASSRRCPSTRRRPPTSPTASASSSSTPDTRVPSPRSHRTARSSA